MEREEVDGEGNKEEALYFSFFEEKKERRGRREKEEREERLRVFFMICRS